MKKQTKIIIGALVLAVTAGGIAFAGKNYRDHKGLHKIFSAKAMLERADANGDLALSQDEVLTVVGARFDKADANSDGILSKAEIITHIENLGEYPRLIKYAGKITDRAVNAVDINGDGQIAKQEIENRLLKYYALADWNDDGSVELAEMKKMRGVHNRHRGKNRHNGE